MIVESYPNTLYLGHVCHRYWVSASPSPIMVGGSLLGAEDWEHLRRDFGISDVINVETEHDDAGKLPPGNLCQARVPDDGSPFPAERVLSVCLFAARRLLETKGAASFYVHCQMGGSRSPGFAYAILRGVLGVGADVALSAIRACPGREAYGDHPYHRSYISSVESALAPSLGA